ncbi:MAG TPA: hypothetical protein VIU64_03430, partial [Polyangia bacterium]
CESDKPTSAAVTPPLPPPPPPEPYARPAYTLLSETGLFADPSSPMVSPDVVAFEPTYRLWSDGAEKRRWFRLPPGTKIDTTDMDHWTFPVGTKVWKEFSLGGVLLETRLVERYGLGPDDYWMGAFVWNAEQTDAVLAPDGQNDIAGTPHDAPSQEKCAVCHRGDVGRVLGLSALQLSRAADPSKIGPTLADLAARDLLTTPPPAPVPGSGAPPYGIPGDAVTVAALGYLHANCGHCHNENGTAWPDTQMVLRSVTADHDVATDAVYASVVGRKVQYWRGGPSAIMNRVTPGDPATSAIIARMMTRGTDDAMPPIATEEIDPVGLAAVSAWITSLGGAAATASTAP